MQKKQLHPTQILFTFGGTLLWLASIGWLISPAYFAQKPEINIEIHDVGSYCNDSSRTTLKPVYSSRDTSQPKP